MAQGNNPFTPVAIARSLAGAALIALGAASLAGYGPTLGDPQLHKIASWVAIAAGIWLIPFLRARR